MICATRVRAATPADVPSIFSLVLALARYEKLEHEVSATEADLAAHFFGDRPYAEALVAHPAAAEQEESHAPAVGFALYFHNYSTFLGRPGIYLEDLFVLPEHRRRGHGRALFAALARVAVERRCGRLEWAVLNWNEPAIAFYRSLGARRLDEWSTFRMTGEAIANLAGSDPAASGAPAPR
jgi:GNAT superfamily N-acetyltransferase